MAKFHLYMDEAGEFEGEIKTRKNQEPPSLIFGVLVPDSEKKQIEKSLLKYVPNVVLSKNSNTPT